MFCPKKCIESESADLYLLPFLKTLLLPYAKARGVVQAKIRENKEYGTIVPADAFLDVPAWQCLKILTEPRKARLRSAGLPS